jgi:glutathione S-transferase
VLTLRNSPASPFVRKVRIAASVLGLDREIMLEPADTMSPSDSVRQQNPLGKIPALVLEDGTVLFDSRVILDYLDHRAGGGRIIPTDAGARFAALRLQALADGLMDASILLVYEGRLRARLPRFSLPGHVATRPSAPCRLARQLRRARAGLRRDHAAELTMISRSLRACGLGRALAGRMHVRDCWVS